MSECVSELPQVYLNPGEFHLAREPAVLRTILGSCVGVTFWCKRIGSGALCHAMLPRFPGDPAAVKPAERWRYVDFCIRELACRFDRLGAHRAEVEIKLFGGADVLPVDLAGLSPRATVGQMNCRRAIEVLQGEGLHIIASDLGGSWGRAIRFHTGTGEVLMRRIVKPVSDSHLPPGHLLEAGNHDS
ncbi:MAG TPA: chemotaxis protein CheD [Terriglobales bacterium]|nr:chemotaxis protein CheD [Terriglobales bacterium]